MPLPEQFGAYWLLERIGQGAQGDIHLARRAEDDAPLVVIKRLSVERMDDDLFMRRFRHEAQMATTVDSDNVARVLDVGQVGSRLYIVMEYIAGQPLSRIFKDLRRIGEYTSLTSIADVVCGALDGLHALHTATDKDGTPLAFVHRDVAPKNLMLSETGVTKVIDLGLGRSVRRDWKTAAGVVMGSPGYIAPEVVGALPVDHRADVFSMGVVLFELLTLKHFMPGKSVVELVVGSTTDNYVRPSSLRSDIPPAVDEIIRRAVELEPERRFLTAGSFSEALRKALPRRSGRDAQTLITQMAWQDILETRVRIDTIAHPAAGFDPIEASRQIVFGQRSNVTTIVRNPMRRGEPPNAMMSPPQSSVPSVRTLSTMLPAPGARWRTGFVVGAAVALFSLGWFGRTLFDRPEPPVRPAPVDTTPRVVPSIAPTPPEAAKTTRPPSRETRRARSKSARSPRKPKKATRVAAPEKKAPTTPTPPSISLRNTFARAKVIAARAKGTPLEKRANDLLWRIQSAGVPGARKTSSNEEIARELAALEAELQ